MHLIDRLRRSGIGVRPDQTVKAVAKTMEQAGVGAVVVVDDDHRPLGIITDRDLVRRALAAGLPLDARADSVMTTDVVTIDAAADAHDALDLIAGHGVRRVPVVEGGHFVGMITADDVLVALAADLSGLARTVAKEIDQPDHNSQPPTLVIG